MTPAQKESTAKKYAMYAKHEFTTSGGAKKYTGEGMFGAKCEVRCSNFMTSDFHARLSTKYNFAVDIEDRPKLARKTCTLLRQSGYKAELAGDTGNINVWKKPAKKKATKKR